MENMSVSIGAGKLKAENITVMERLGLEVGAGKAKLKNMHVRNLAIECGVGKCHYEGVLEHDMKVQCGVGQVEAELDAEESDYNYSISCALGKIKINDNSMGTFASEKQSSMRMQGETLPSNVDWEIFMLQPEFR